MCRRTSSVISKTQLMSYLLQIGEIDRTLPRVGDVRVVSLGSSLRAEEVDIWEIEQIPNFQPKQPQTYKLTRSSKAGRELDDSIKEAHVRKYNAHYSLRFSLAIQKIDAIYLESRKADPSSSNHFAFQISGNYKKLNNAWKNFRISRADCVEDAEAYLFTLTKQLQLQTLPKVSNLR